MEPQFVTKPAFTVVGLRIQTKPMGQEIPALWDQFVPRMGEIPYQAQEHASYGLMDNFDFAQSKLDYMAGNPVEQVDELPAGMTRWDVPANTYAVFAATLATIPQTFDFIYNTWPPTSDYQQVAGPYFERYGEDFSPANPVLSIYIPIAKRS